jgi:hypothetical protein
MDEERVRISVPSELPVNNAAESFVFRFYRSEFTFRAS